MRIIEAKQGSAEWHAIRCGRVTASRAGDVMAFRKDGGERAERRDYRIELVMSILTGLLPEHYASADMERGTMLEPEAPAAYELARDCMVETVGFIEHETIPRYGGSPDGLIDAGGIQIKVPRITTYLKWVRDGVVPDEHLWQMHSEMDVYERAWMDFVAYCPEMPKGARLFIRRLDRDEKKVAALHDGVHAFWADLEEEIARIEKEFGPLPRPTPQAQPSKSDEFGDLGLTEEDLKYIS